MIKKDKSKYFDWLKKEDWKINVWDKSGKLLIKDGKPIKKK